MSDKVKGRLHKSRKMGEGKRDYFVCVHIREKYFMHLIFKV